MHYGFGTLIFRGGLFTSECCEDIRLVEAEELGRRWVGIDKEDFSELVSGRLRDIESMFAADLQVVHRHDSPVKPVRDDGLPKGSRRRSPVPTRRRGRPKKVRLELASAVASSTHNGASEESVEAIA